MIPVKNTLRVGIVLVFSSMLFIAVHIVNYMLSGQATSFYPVVYVITAFALSFTVSEIISKPAVFIILLAVVSLTVNLILVIWVKTERLSDFALLYNLAVDLKNGDYEALRSNAYFTRWAYQSLFVIYEAAVITLLPGGEMPLLILNAFFMTGINILIYQISRTLINDKAAIFITLLYLFYPVPYFLTSVLTNQHISMFFILLGLLFLVKKHDIKNAIISGVLIALGNAFRPDAMIIVISLLIMVLILLITFKRTEGLVNKIKPYLITIAAFFITGVLISGIISISGVNPNGQGNEDPLWKFVIGLNYETQGKYSEKLAKEVFSVEDKALRNELEYEIIIRHLSIGKIEFAKFLYTKTATTWQSFEDSNWAFKNQYDKILPIVNKPFGTILNIVKQAERWYILIVTVFTLLALIKMTGKEELNVTQVIFGLIFILFFFSSILIEVQPRYRYFAVPFIFMLSGELYNDKVFNRLRKRFNSRKPLYGKKPLS